MTKESKFKLEEGVHYNSEAGAYTARFTDRNGQYAQFILDKEMGDNLGKIIKTSEVSKLSWASRNADKNSSAIVIFNIPEENKAYKIVFDPFFKDIIKAFSSVEEGKWTAVPSVSKELKAKFYKEVDKLMWYLLVDTKEGPCLSR